MNVFLRTTILTGAIVGCVGFVAFAQSVNWRGSDGWGLSSSYEQLCRSWSPTSFSGYISKIDTATPGQDMGYGIQISLKMDREEVPVYLGPAWYIIHQDMDLSLNDNVTVNGIKTAINGKPVIIAGEVIRKDKTLKIRDPDGIPYWIAWRKR